MLTQARSSCSPDQPNQLRSVRAQVEKFVRLVQKKSIELSQENRRARVRDTDVYRAIWLVIGNKMPLDRVKKLSKGRGTVAKVHVRHERQRKEMKAGVMAVVTKELEALKSQKLGTPPEVDEQNMETDHSPQSEAAKSSNSVEMRSEESSGPSTSAAQGSAAQAATGTKTSSPDDVSVDMSPEKCESISIAEVPGEGRHGDAIDPNQNVDETLYEVKEPDSDSSASNLSGIVKEVVEMDEVSSKPLASLPEDDTATEKIDSESEWESEPRDSDEDSVDKLREYPTEVLTEDDTMKEVTEQLAETNIRPGKKITPKRAPNRSEEEMPAKVRPKSFGFSGTAIRPESLSLENSPMPSQRLRTQRRLPNLEPDAPGPSQDSTSLKRFHMSAPGPSREIPTPIVSIVVTPPEEEPEGPED